MDIVAIDILSGLPVTKEGHKYLLVGSCNRLLYEADQSVPIERC